MLQAETGIEKMLFAKEERLLTNEYRSDATFVSQITGDGCIEVTEAGKKIARNSPTMETIEGAFYLTDNKHESRMLSDDCILLLFEAVQVKKDTRIKSACSSIWKNIDGDWKTVFRQRTVIDQKAQG